MKEKYDSLFWWFEETLFEHKYDVPPNTSLVMEYREWIQNITSDELAEKLGVNPEFVEVARQEIITACNDWLK